MENATKALLMAGAVLIAILLIAMGMRIFNATSDTTHQTEVTMQTEQAQIFNGQFDAYIGTTLSASKATALQQKVKASNAVSKSHSINGNILNYSIVSTKKYKVTVTTDSYGYYKTMTISVAP